MYFFLPLFKCYKGVQNGQQNNLHLYSYIIIHLFFLNLFVPEIETLVSPVEESISDLVVFLLKGFLIVCVGSLGAYNESESNVCMAVSNTSSIFSFNRAEH